MVSSTTLLRSELTVFYGSEDFKGKSDYEILRLFQSNSVATIFEQIYKLSNLVSTIPATTT
jgi:hypothetical protein